MVPVSKGKISYTLQAFNIIPLLFLGIAVLLLGTQWFTRTMYDEVEVELDNVAHNVVTLFEVAYPGDYRLEGEIAYRLFKGDQDITNEYALIDRVKEDTDLEVTLFYYDTRILTTIRDTAGKRIVGTGAPSAVIQNVLKEGESHFYNNAYINDTEYFAYYIPLHNSNEDVVGMMFVGKPSSKINQAIRRSVYPLAIADLLVMIITAVCVFLYTKDFASILLKIHLFLSDVSTGNLNAELDSAVLRRNDELGDIGRSAIMMQRSLRTMVEQDTLTKLFNRRSGDRKLRLVIEKSAKNQTPFCVAIGDIDFFKRVNDTYGHDCGDVILKQIAGKLTSHIYRYGFAARWGGEEFLLVFDHTDMENSLRILEELLEDIRNMEYKYEEHVIQVTMTFGLVSGDTTDIRQLIRQADEKLYLGKSMGRNRIIS